MSTCPRLVQDYHLEVAGTYQLLNMALVYVVTRQALRKSMPASQIYSNSNNTNRTLARRGVLLAKLSVFHFCAIRTESVSQ